MFPSARFDVAVRAMRGEFDPAEDVSNTESDTGNIMSSLVNFPARHTFNVVLKPGEESAEAVKARVLDAIAAAANVLTPALDVECKVSEGRGYDVIYALALLKTHTTTHTGFCRLRFLGAVEWQVHFDNCAVHRP